jgi:hypothetical protein
MEATMTKGTTITTNPAVSKLEFRVPQRTAHGEIEFERFQGLAGALLKVSKSELDAKREES